MLDASHLDAFLAGTHPTVRRDLSTSYCEALTIRDLMDLAETTERARWNQLGLRYTDPDGSLALRISVAELYTELDESGVVCCLGAQDSLMCVARAILSRGDRAIIVLPIFQPLEWTITEYAEVTGVALDPDRLCLDIDRIEAAITPRTKMVLMNFPNSPTGAVLDGATLRDLVALCRKHGLWLVNDEVYRHLIWGPPVAPVADMYERGISVDSLTKGFGVPGLRVGWVACQDRALLSRISLAKARLANYVAAPSEALANIALQNREVFAARARLVCLRNRRRLHGVLNRYPDVFAPEMGKSLIFACPPYLGAEGADAFADRLLAATGVRVLPTSLWRSPLGPTPENRLRIGLGLSKCLEGLDVLEPYLDAELAIRSMASRSSDRDNHRQPMREAAAAPKEGEEGG